MQVAARQTHQPQRTFHHYVYMARLLMEFVLENTKMQLDEYRLIV